MANKKPRNKKFNQLRTRTSHITNVLNKAINKFYMMGDMNHDPMSFHVSDIKMHLRGNDLGIALSELAKFFYGEKRHWAIGIYHFFKINDKVEVVPTIIKMDGVDLREVAEVVDVNIQLAKEAIMDPEEGYTEENHFFYGYYINYGDNLSWDAMEPDIIQAFMKVNRDFENVSPDVCTCTAEKVLQAIAGEKFSITDSNRLKTTMTEEVE